MAYSVLQIVLWNIFQVLFVCWLLNVVVVFTCLQHTFPAFDLHSVQLPSFKVFKSFLILPLSIQCVPIISWMLLFCLNAVIGSFLKIFLRFLFTRKIFQFFVMVLVIFCRNQLYIIKRGILSDLYIYIYIYIFHAGQLWTKNFQVAVFIEPYMSLQSPKS